MKKLEELGISPWPWNVDDSKYGDKNDVVCNYVCDTFIKGEVHTKVVAHTNHNFDSSEADACFIAAAPDMYKALYKCVLALEHIYECEGYDYGTMGEYNAAKAVLAKASGEEVGQ